jgi:two-component system, NtrC family, nitrogen regulation sensor histidine kinase NtrY
MSRLRWHSGKMATTAAADQIEQQSLLRRMGTSIIDAFGNSQSIKLLEISSALMLATVTVVTVVILLDQGPRSEPLSPAASATMLVANLLPATLLLVLFGRRVALKRAERSNIGSKQLLHVILVAVPERRPILVFRFRTRHARKCGRACQRLL